MIMIAFMRISLKDGISKKILAQAAALSKLKNSCTLLCLDENDSFQVVEYKRGEFENSSLRDHIDIDWHSLKRVNGFIDACESIIGQSKYSIYIRHMIPSIRYLKFLNKYRNNTIYYEIPTYPYYYEQISVSSNKVMTIFRLIHETIFWPFIYKKIKSMLVIPCRTNAKHYKKMVFVTNGFPEDVADSYGSKEHNSDEIVLIGVGTIHKYHGYDKVIHSMAQYKGRRKLKFIIVGGGDIKPLQQTVTELDMDDRVVFTGPKSGVELKELYDMADLGVGTMALEYRKADIDTGIKVLDYYSHGLPVISSGKCPDIPGIPVTPYYKYDENFNMDDMILWLSKFDNHIRDEIANRTRREFCWENIIGMVIDGKEN